MACIRSRRKTYCIICGAAKTPTGWPAACVINAYNLVISSKPQENPNQSLSLFTGVSLLLLLFTQYVFVSGGGRDGKILVQSNVLHLFRCLLKSNVVWRHCCVPPHLFGQGHPLTSTSACSWSRWASPSAGPATTAAWTAGSSSRTRSSPAQHPWSSPANLEG